MASVTVLAGSGAVPGSADTAPAAHASPPADASPPAGVGFLDSVSSRSPEGSDARLVLQARQNRANLLVAIVAADGPDSSAGQQVLVSDNRRHVWTLRDRHLVSGSVIDVFTAPGTGHDAGTVVSSHLTQSGGEGQALTVAAYASGYYYDTTYIHGSGGIPRLDQNMPPGTDTYTVFVDGRQNRPIALLPGEHPVNVDPVAGDGLFQISHTDSHSFVDGVMVTGNSGPVASTQWLLLDVNILPAG